MILTIDEEYTGKEEIIKETLEKLLVRRFSKKWQGEIRYARIGKTSEAHRLAWKTHRSKQKTGIKRITQEEILNLLK